MFIWDQQTFCIMVSWLWNKSFSFENINFQLLHLKKLTCHSKIVIKQIKRFLILWLEIFIVCSLHDLKIPSTFHEILTIPTITKKKVEILKIFQLCQHFNIFFNHKLTVRNVGKKSPAMPWYLLMLHKKLYWAYFPNLLYTQRKKSLCSGNEMLQKICKSWK